MTARVKLDIDATREKLAALGLGYAVDALEGLLAEAVRIRNQALLVRLLVVLLSLPVAWWLASRVARPLKALARETSLIRRFEFESPISTRSRIHEVDDLAVAMGMMKSTISRFVALINSLAAEQDFDRMLHTISHSTLQVSGADLAGIYLVDEDAGQVRPVAVNTRDGLQGVEPDTLPVYSLGKVSPDDELSSCIAQGEICLETIRRQTAAAGGINELLLDRLLPVTGCMKKRLRWWTPSWTAAPEPVRPNSTRPPMSPSVNP